MADVAAATGELASFVPRALGRGIVAPKIYEARRALELLLGWLPDCPEAAE